MLMKSDKALVTFYTYFILDLHEYDFGYEIKQGVKNNSFQDGILKYQTQLRMWVVVVISFPWISFLSFDNIWILVTMFAQQVWEKVLKF